MNIILPVLFFMVAVGVTMTVLHFAKFKQKNSECCGAFEVCPNEGKEDECENNEQQLTN